MKKLVFFLVLPLVLFASCNKAPGEGGTSSITGKVFVYDLNVTGLDTLESYYAMDRDVFIIYGDEDSTYDDKFSTSLDGSFRFDNLTLGTYTLFAYSRCDACTDNTEAITKVVEITAKKTNYDVGDIVILK